MTVATFTSVINQLLPEPHAGLLNGIIFGTKAAIPRELYDALVTTGTLHIVALSGMNITIIVRVMHAAFLRMVSRRITNLLTILFIAGFVWFVGPSASVIRAAIMGSLVLLATVLGRQNWSMFTFALTCAVMILIKPQWIGDLSFQLSALATLGILLFARTTGNPITDDLRVTLSAQVFTIPLILFTFQRISFISPLTNILIGWVIPILTPLGMAVALAGWMFLPLGQVFSWAAWVLLEYLIIVIELTAKIPFASVGK